jgi:cytochrome c biogenesis protein CcdA
MTLLFSIMALAVVDSLNPSLFVAQFYLITTPKPVARLLSYIAGIMLVNVAGGVLILGGMKTLIETVIASLSRDTIYAGQLLLGVIILGFGLWVKINRDTAAVHKPRSLLPVHTFLLGMVVMLNEITTALPYFLALEHLANAALSDLLTLMVLLLYNAVFSLPLFVFVALFVIFQRRFTAQLDRLTRAVGYWSPRVIKYGSLLFGGLILIDAVIYFMRG